MRYSPHSSNPPTQLPALVLWSLSFLIAPAAILTAVAAPANHVSQACPRLAASTAAVNSEILAMRISFASLPVKPMGKALPIYKKDTDSFRCRYPKNQSFFHLRLCPDTAPQITKAVQQMQT
jgi:hypothetical protein